MIARLVPRDTIIAKSGFTPLDVSRKYCKGFIKIIINKIIIKLLIEINKTGEKKCLYQEWI